MRIPLAKASRFPYYSAVMSIGRKRALRVRAVALVATVAVLATAATADARLYSRFSAFNRPIGETPVIDPNSSAMVDTLVASANARGFAIASNEWTVPVYYADATTPRHDVAIAGQPPGAHYDPAFVHDVPRVMRDVPIPPEAAPDPQIDGHMTVIDEGSGCEYDLYGASKVGSTWHALWANRISTRSNGVYQHGLSTRGTGFAPLAGMIWPEELQAGRIDHALMFAFPTTRAGGPVLPATASDGKTVDPNAIPQGARVQLDPELDLDTLDLTPTERIIARALQRYGMLLGDTGGALSLYAVGAQSFPEYPYGGFLERTDVTYLSGIPVSRFRVLVTHEQHPLTPLAIDESPCAAIEPAGQAAPGALAAELAFPEA
jgi:hypothetical protein